MLPEEDKLAIVIEGTVRPTFLGKEFRVILYQNKYGGWQIRGHPETFKYIEVGAVVDQTLSEE